MSIVKEDVQVLDEVFKTLDKAVFNNVDGDEIIRIYQSFSNLRRLEMKLSKMVEESIKEKSGPEPGAKKKSKKKAKKD